MNLTERVSELSVGTIQKIRCDEHYNAGLYFTTLPPPRLYFKQGLFSSYICGRTGN